MSRKGDDPARPEGPAWSLNEFTRDTDGLLAVSASEKKKKI